MILLQYDNGALPYGPTYLYVWNVTSSESQNVLRPVFTNRS
jgi:hypothetical protein